MEPIRYGPVTFMEKEAKIIIKMLLDGHVVIPFPRRSGPPIEFGIKRHSNWIFREVVRPEEYEVEQASRAVIIKAIELAGPLVQYDEEAKEIIDARGDGGTLEVGENRIDTIEFDTHMVEEDGSKILVRVFMMQQMTEIEWGCNHLFLEGHAPTFEDAKRNAITAIRSWMRTAAEEEDLIKNADTDTAD